MSTITEVTKMPQENDCITVSCNGCGGVLYEGPRDMMPLKGWCAVCPRGTGGHWEKEVCNYCGGSGAMETELYEGLVSCPVCQNPEDYV